MYATQRDAVGSADTEAALPPVEVLVGVEGQSAQKPAQQVSVVIDGVLRTCWPNPLVAQHHLLACFVDDVIPGGAQGPVEEHQPPSLPKRLFTVPERQEVFPERLLV